MATQTCPDCDYPSNGNCRHCHGTGKNLSDKFLKTSSVESPCTLCEGSGVCPTCGGGGEIEPGGESD